MTRKNNQLVEARSEFRSEATLKRLPSLIQHKVTACAES
jgi:hypothetical protein